MQEVSTQHIPNNFAAVIEFSRKMQPDIDQFSEEQFGDFTLIPNFLSNRDLPYIEYHTIDGLYVKVNLSNCRDQYEIASLQVLKDGELWTVDQYNICMEKYIDPNSFNNFPKYEFRYGNEANKIETFGKLEYLSYSISDNQMVYYVFKEDQEIKRTIPDNPELNSQFPERLSGKNEIKELAINWQINAAEVEAELIKHSRIFEFLALIPFKL